MGTTVHVLISFSLFLHTINYCHGASVHTGTDGCIPRERDALLAFKKGITKDPTGILASWRRRGHAQEDCCRWRGVLCHNRTGHVLRLQLRHFPTYIGQTGMVGLIGPSLLSLADLQYLDLSLNSLTGPTGSIPEFLGSFKSLKHLNLSGMPFTGMVPHRFGNLSNLNILDLSSCSELQVQSRSDVAWLERLHSLQYLNLDAVNLRELDDWPHVVNTLPYLRVLKLSDCSLMRIDQKLPRVNLTRLEILDLSINQLISPVSSCWFWNVTSLKYLNLFRNRLYGSVPNALEGMTSLRVLDFSSNRAAPLGLTGRMPSSQTPDISSKDTDASYGTGIDIMAADLRNLCSLEILDFSESLLSGNIADLFESLVQCSSGTLQQLALRYNNITGILPKSMGMFSELVFLDLSENSITGHIPSEIGMLKSLKHLDLNNNALDHFPSEVGKLKKLTYLDLNNNFLNHLPSEIGMLTELTYLDLHNNLLNGVITETHFAHLTSLKEIYLINNSLHIVVDPEWLPSFRLEYAYFDSCRMGPRFPTWLQSQVGIICLDISNAHIRDTLPAWFSKVFSKTTELYISNNQISGRLPTNMESMSLQKFYADSNNITGEIPPLPRNLEILDISRNSLSGHLPSNNTAPRLAQLNLFSNKINGHVPGYFCGLQCLVTLDLANNLIEGELPACFFKESMDLKFLRLRNNAFTGSFPPSLRGSQSLHFVDLSLNKLEGILPQWIGSLLNLRILQLSHNLLSGNIPASITGLKELRHLNLAGNNISGALPKHFSKMLALTGKPYNETETVAAPGAQYDSPVTMKGQERSYNEEKVELTTIDLSSNFLTGGIPQEIISLGNLVNLNLSRNYLSGIIPAKIGAMQKLLSLDLSRNKLNGEIPSSLSNLTYLSFLDLSYNRLSGRIPSGSQIETLYSQNSHIYDGNEGLCGRPIEKNCSRNDPPKQGQPISGAQNSLIEQFYFAFLLGFIAGLWVVFCGLSFRKSWRVSYFHFFDRVYEKVYVLVVVRWAALTLKTAKN